MENLVFTQLSIAELQQIFRQELKSFFENNKQSNQNPSETDQLLTIQEAGALLTLSVPTLYGLVHRAAIPVSKKGKRLYFSKYELTEWIKAGRKLTLTEIDSKASTYMVNQKRK